MGNGLGKDNPEEGAAVGVAQRVGRFILALVNRADPHPQQAEHR